MRALIVRESFGAYVKGAMITDPETIETILKGKDSAHVMRTTAPEPIKLDPPSKVTEPAAAPSAKPSPKA
jgi:hypothetical protein